MRNDTLLGINQSINTLPALELRKTRLQDRIVVSRTNLASLKEIYVAKGMSVDKTKSRSLSSTLSKVIGRSGINQNKAMTDMLAAKLNYEKELEHVKDLEEENEDLTQRITNLKKRKTILDEEITRREKDIASDKNHDLHEIYMRIQAENSNASSQLVENDEALKAARKVLASDKASQIELENAQSWTSSDMWGGSGLVSRTTNLSKIDHAQSTFNRLSTQMNDLERELGDVHLTKATILTTISTANHMVESWFDNILSVQDVAAVLRDNLVQLRVLATQVTGLIETLEKNEEEIRTRITLLEKEKEDLLVTCASCENDAGEGTVCGIK